jgi:hypothetical protein
MHSTFLHLNFYEGAKLCIGDSYFVTSYVVVCLIKLRLNMGAGAFSIFMQIAVIMKSTLLGPVEYNTVHSLRHLPPLEDKFRNGT